jgi:hypothetical protein
MGLMELWMALSGIGLGLVSFFGGVAVGIYVERATRRTRSWDELDHDL